MMVLNISVRPRALMVSPLRIAAVRAVGAPELLLPMQKVAGSVSLQIGTFDEGRRIFRPRFAGETPNRFAEPASETLSENKRTLRFAGGFGERLMGLEPTTFCMAKQLLISR
jgi:hypothetical protein